MKIVDDILEHMTEVSSKFEQFSMKTRIAKDSLKLALIRKNQEEIVQARNAYIQAITESTDLYIEFVQQLDEITKDLKVDPLQEAVNKGAEELNPKTN